MKNPKESAKEAMEISLEAIPVLVQRILEKCQLVNLDKKENLAYLYSALDNMIIILGNLKRAVLCYTEDNED